VDARGPTDAWPVVVTIEWVMRSSPRAAHRCAMALHDIEHGVLADPEPLTDLPVRLAGADHLQDLGIEPIGLDSLAGRRPHTTPHFFRRRDPGAHPLAQQVSVRTQRVARYNAP
jgi:hypothetical protein